MALLRRTKKVEDINTQPLEKQVEYSPISESPIVPVEEQNLSQLFGEKGLLRESTDILSQETIQTSSDSFEYIPDPDTHPAMEMRQQATLVDKESQHALKSQAQEIQENQVQDRYAENKNGWNSMDDEVNIRSLPRNGMPVRLAEIPDGDGTLAFWKRTRAFHAKRWQETGKWCDFMTGMDIDFIPKYWKIRYGI